MGFKECSIHTGNVQYISEPRVEAALANGGGQ